LQNGHSTLSQLFCRFNFNVYVPDEHADFIERLTDPTKYSARNLVKENLLALQALEGSFYLFFVGLGLNSFWWLLSGEEALDDEALHLIETTQGLAAESNIVSGEILSFLQICFNINVTHTGLFRLGRDTGGDIIGASE
jgi:hypothetical protein